MSPLSLRRRPGAGSFHSAAPDFLHRRSPYEATCRLIASRLRRSMGLVRWPAKPASRLPPPASRLRRISSSLPLIEAHRDVIVDASEWLLGHRNPAMRDRGYRAPRPGEISEGRLDQGQPELLARGQNEDDAVPAQGPVSKGMGGPAFGLQGGSEGLEESSARPLVA